MGDTQIRHDRGFESFFRIVMIVLVLTGIVAGVYGGLRVLLRANSPPLQEAAKAAPSAMVKESLATGEPPAPAKHPIAATPRAPGVVLDASDASLIEEISQLGGASGLKQWLRPTQVIRHIVATVDALPRRQVPLKAFPVRPAPGIFRVESHDGRSYIEEANAERYVPYVTLLNSLEPTSVASVYRRFYPLFRQAYRELGYPDGNFNDRLIEAIDDVLATPAAPGPLQIESPGAMWKYADPDVESLSAGQKILLRMGSANAQSVRGWLTAFRKAIA